ncbi:hypothetical protein D5086_027157 [Populus alba]|uniref:Uncharacterized protein n=1 Tax=Populus alba TaxID=43335 RepID=A0ACC4B3S8_POPAL
MAKNKRTTPAPPLPPSPPTLTPSPKAVAGGSSPDKFLIFAEEGSIPQPIVSSPSTPDHVIVKDYSDEEDYEEDEVDYSASRGNSRSFHSPVPPSIGNNLDITLNSASRVLPLSGSGHLVIPVTTPTKRRSSPVPALQHNFLGLVEVDHNLPNEIVKSKKARKSPSIPVRGTLAADHVSTIHPSSKAPAVLSSGATCTPDYNSPIIIHEKELARATPSRTDPNEVPVGIATKRGQRRSLSRASGSGSGGRVLPSPAII